MNDKRYRGGANRENVREYLDVEIGRVLLGEPVKTLAEIGQAFGRTKNAMFLAERRILRKVGAAFRECM